MKYQPITTSTDGLMRAIDEYTPGTFDYAQTGFIESLQTSALGLVYTASQIMQAKEDGMPLTREQFVRSPDYRDGIEYEDGMTDEYLKLLKDEWERREREKFMSERATIGQEFGRFGMGIAGAIPAVENLLPFGAMIRGTAMGTKVFGRIATTKLREKALLGTLDGFGGSILLQPAIMAVKEELQTDYTASDAAADVLISTGAGTIFGAGAHLVGTKLNRHKNRLTLDRQVDEANEARAAFDEDRPVNNRPPTPEQITTDPYQPERVTVEPYSRDPQFENTVTIGDGKERFRTKLVIRELSEVAASHNDDGTVNTNYPQEFQPRQERGSAQMMAEVDSDARRLDPTLLGESPVPQYGSPITYGSNVLSGNGRLMKIRRAASQYPEVYANYVNALRDSGYSVDGFETPVLVRELVVDDKFEPVRFARESNVDLVTQLTETETAFGDAGRIDDTLTRTIVNDVLDAAGNQTAVNRIAQKIFSKVDLNRFFKDGKLNSAGMNRIRNAIFVKAFGDYTVVRNALQSENMELKGLFSSMEKIAVPLARLRAAMETGRVYPLELHDDIQVALREIYNLAQREQPITIRERLDELIGVKQEDLFGGETTQINGELNAKQLRLLQLFDEYKNAPDQAAKIIRDLTKKIEDMGDYAQQSFDQQDVPKLGQMIDEVVGTAIMDARVKRELDAAKRQIAQELGVQLRKDKPEPVKKNSPEKIAEYNDAVAKRREELTQGMELEGPKAAEDDISYAVGEQPRPEPLPPATAEAAVEPEPDMISMLEREVDEIRGELSEEELAAIADADETGDAIAREAQAREETANCILRNMT